MKTFGVTNYTNLAPLKCCGRTDRQMGKMSKLNTHQKRENKMKQFHKIGGAHLQCVNNHYTKFGYQGMNTVGVTDYTN